MPAHSPRRDDGTEGLQDVGGGQALLGVEDQQFPDEAHGALRNPPVPNKGEGKGRAQVGWAGAGSQARDPKPPCAVSAPCACRAGLPSPPQGGRTHSGMVYSAALILRKSSCGMLS